MIGEDIANTHFPAWKYSWQLRTIRPFLNAFIEVPFKAVTIDSVHKIMCTSISN
jgi:hypothetical protein